MRGNDRQLQFEYLAKSAVMMGPTAEYVQRVLNEAGKDGWELVAVHALGPNLWPTFIMKRPVRPAPDEPDLFT